MDGTGECSAATKAAKIIVLCQPHTGKSGRLSSKGAVLARSGRDFPDRAGGGDVIDPAVLQRPQALRRGVDQRLAGQGEAGLDQHRQAREHGIIRQDVAAQQL